MKKAAFFFLPEVGTGICKYANENHKELCHLGRATKYDTILHARLSSSNRFLVANQPQASFTLYCCCLICHISLSKKTTAISRMKWHEKCAQKILPSGLLNGTKATRYSVNEALFSVLFYYIILQLRILVLVELQEYYIVSNGKSTMRARVKY